MRQYTPTLSENERIFLKIERALSKTNTRKRLLTMAETVKALDYLFAHLIGHEQFALYRTFFESLTLLFFAQEDRADAKFMNIASVEETVRFAKEDVLEHIDSFIEI